eukprot:TRINITY_DN16986_c0_g1_i1.p1 TRINITY_DN16986_c0_g1~~TRINITY_DN16986_c0_g1_i1.p1  ORF type:complete len:144 (-),score=27.19 TRINITY_DN16986_c0_g1_i1:343-723(-)
MSWQAYVDSQLVGTGHCTKAAILGHDGNQWAASAGFAVSAAEGKAIANSFNDPSSAFSTGIHLLGCKYMTIKADQRSIYGKLKGAGVACCKTSQAILVGVYDETIQPGQCATVVERLGDYLIEQGY